MSDGASEPYRALGSKIKFLRQQWNQTLEEVSGTLEIESSTLKSIEEGKALPHDELLEMLIAHFLLTEEQAIELKQLAKPTDSQQDMDSLASGIEDMLMKQIVMLTPSESRTIYTDSMHAAVNDSGVTMQFMQTTPNGKQTPISRVGMSRKHAERVIKVLQETLREYDKNNNQKLLPKSERDERKN